MLADHAAGVAPGSAGLGAEARRQRRQPHRQFLLVEDGFAHEVGERHFGGGDEAETFAPQLAHDVCIAGGQQLAFDRPELIVFELRQLPRAEHHVIAHQQRRIDFGVAVLAGVEIEHELPDRALEPRQALLQHHEARAGQFRRRLEIHEAERVAEIVMRLRRERVVAHRAEDVALHIAVLVDALGHVVQRQVRDRGELSGELFVRRLRRHFELRHRGLELGDLGHQRARRARRPWPSWRRRFPSTRNCAAPAPAPTSGSPRGASRRSPAATPTTAPARAASARRRRRVALSRIDLMSCMAIQSCVVPAKAGI